VHRGLVAARSALCTTTELGDGGYSDAVDVVLTDPCRAYPLSLASSSNSSSRSAYLTASCGAAIADPNPGPVR
jgi:hypothetical protein